jgi:hypothetical protein
MEALFRHRTFGEIASERNVPQVKTAPRKKQKKNQKRKKKKKNRNKKQNQTQKQKQKQKKTNKQTMNSQPMNSHRWIRDPSAGKAPFHLSMLLEVMTYLHWTEEKAKGVKVDVSLPNRAVHLKDLMCVEDVQLLYKVRFFVVALFVFFISFFSHQNR